MSILPRRLAACAFLTILPAAAQAQSWTPLKTAPSFAPASAFLMTDGTVLIQDSGSCGCGAGDWWKLTPDSTGSYVNGTWSQIASMPSSYKPLYYASAVLPSGKLIVMGGEYNGGASGVWTTLGALYDPLADSWVSVPAPKGWSTIGDAQSAVLANGKFMMANCCTKDEAILDESKLTWTATGTGKADINDEEGWTLLPTGQLLTVDANDTADLKHTEMYTKGSWAFAGDTPVELPDTGTKTNSHELGPQILRPDGTVFVAGATGHTAIWSPSTKAWTQGPDFPTSSGKTLDSADGPAALLPSGNVLVAASPGVFQTNTKFYEFDGAKLNAVPVPPNAKQDSSFYLRLLVLPTGQVLETDGSTDIEIYTPSGSANSLWAPKITSFPKSVTRGSTYTLTGVRLNGMSQAIGYGDDYQAATNYPIARITMSKTGHVFYARTADFSSMAVSSNKKVTASVQIPGGIEIGDAKFEVVANGIASAARKVVVQ